jgi:hypothetical protein
MLEDKEDTETVHIIMYLVFSRSKGAATVVATSPVIREQTV